MFSQTANNTQFLTIKIKVKLKIFLNMIDNKFVSKFGIFRPFVIILAGKNRYFPLFIEIRTDFLQIEAHDFR